MQDAQAEWDSSPESIAGAKLVKLYYTLRLEQESPWARNMQRIIVHIVGECLRNPDQFSADVISVRLALLRVFSRSNSIDAELGDMAEKRISALFQQDETAEGEFEILMRLDVPTLCALVIDPEDISLDWMYSIGDEVLGEVRVSKPEPWKQNMQRQKRKAPGRLRPAVVKTKSGRVSRRPERWIPDTW